MKIVWLFVLASLSACTHIPTVQERNESAAELAAHAGWKKEFIETDHFTLASFLPTTLTTTETLTIYIEGDGLAWFNSSTPSEDPTPMNALALKLALRDDSPSIYLARPCQFITDENNKNCAKKYWTGSRFSAEVIESTNQAIDQIKHRFKVNRFILVGYSGGGAVAALVAARRTDVARLITIAGNIDHRAWTKENHISPLSDSLNPADEWIYLQHLPQLHYVGGKDQVIGEYVARSYAAHFPSNLTLSIVIIPEFDHHCCWLEKWPALKNSTVISVIKN
jgi:pimeloyl-ACP methyl ester carboxylesterase